MRATIELRGYEHDEFDGRWYRYGRPMTYRAALHRRDEALEGQPVYWLICDGCRRKPDCWAYVPGSDPHEQTCPKSGRKFSVTMRYWRPYCQTCQRKLRVDRETDRMHPGFFRRTDDGPWYKIGSNALYDLEFCDRCETEKMVRRGSQLRCCKKRTRTKTSGDLMDLFSDLPPSPRR